MHPPSAGSSPGHIGHHGMIWPAFHPVWGDGGHLDARWNGGMAADGGRMAQTVRFQETLRRLAMIDEGFVEDQAGLRMGLAGAPPVCVEWSTGRALAAGATDEEITDTLLAIAPVTGLGRVVCAAPDVAAALGADGLGAPGD